MKEHPILFSTPMVKAILEGRKTMTRRIISKSGLLEDYSRAKIIRDAEVCDPDSDESFAKIKILKGLCVEFDEGEWNVRCKYDIGDILWVRETWCRVQTETGLVVGFNYKASGGMPPKYETWRPSIFMPKEACRIFLEITNIRVEKVKDITEQDAFSEGVRFTDFGKNIYNEQHRGFHVFDVTHQDQCLGTARTAFGNLWEVINGPDSWNNNPWVWVYEFKRIDHGGKI